MVFTTVYIFLTSQRQSFSVLYRNNLKDLPWGVGELSHLKILRLKYNQFEQLPQVLVRLQSLEILEIADNQISGVDDSVLSHLRRVK